MSSAPDPGSHSEPGRQSRRSALTRERILAAATTVFARRGFHGSRVADIADHAGIAYGLVYHHFKNKEEILAAIYSEQWGSYVRYIEDTRQMPLSFNDKMARLVHFWVQAYRQEPDVMTVMINEITRSYEFLESHDIGTLMVAFDSIQAIIEEAQVSGDVAADVDAKVATYTVLGAAEMILTGYVLGTLKRTTEKGFRDDEQQIVRLILRGMAPS